MGRSLPFYRISFFIPNFKIFYDVADRYFFIQKGNEEMLLLVVSNAAANAFPFSASV